MVKLEAVYKRVTTLHESVDLHMRMESIIDHVLTIADRMRFSITEIHEPFLARPAKMRSLSLPSSVSDINVGIGRIKPPVFPGKNELKKHAIQIESHMSFLKRCIDADSGFIESLNKMGVISLEAAKKITAESSGIARAERLLELLIKNCDDNQYVKFSSILDGTGQKHVADYLRNDGDLDVDERPLSLDEMSWIDATQRELVDIIDPRELLPRLLIDKCITVKD